MKSKTIKLGLVLSFIALMMSCKSNAQSDTEEKEHHQPPSIEEIFKMMDDNNDNKLAKEEVRGPLKRDFSKIDTDEDGFITKEELEKAPKPNHKRGPKQTHD
ncbi:EF-hand domain-containing protein [Aquimarina sp. AU119]|uniref:EF-hand domain-containing protein n=1 Tax=Aquimarina sp. AU119 TaxID=2108528 RepID=UPI000D6953DA|nr:EF-hand domain-containing protein [Aquimarina sp. AU119]